jgi:hypothetical protein
MSFNDFKLIKPSTSESSESSYTPFKENIELYQGSILEDKHFEEKMNTNFVSRPTITLQPSEKEHLETEKSAIFNPQLTNSSSSHNDSLMEEHSSEESKTKECDFHNGESSTYKRVMKPPLTPSPDAHFSLHKKYVETEMLPANPPTSDKHVTRQDNAVRPTSDGEPKQLDFQEEQRRHGPIIKSNNRSVHSADTCNNREHTHTNVYPLNRKERKRFLFQKTLPNHYYPVFMKSLQPDTPGPTDLHSTNCDHLKEPSNEAASSFPTKENITFSGIPSVSRKETTQCGDGTWAADSENVMERVKEIQPLPEEEEENFSNTDHIPSEASVLKKSSKSQHVSEGSHTSENRCDDEDRGIENEKTDSDSELKDYPVPNFDLVKDIDSFLVGMFNEDSTECKATNIHNSKDNKNFMANVPTSTKYLDRNKLVSHGFPDNGNGYLHRITRNDIKYEPILNLLLKDVSKKEIMSSSSIMEANEQYDTNVLSLSQFQFQPQSQTTCINLGAKNKLTISHFTQKPQDHDSIVTTNQNSKHIPPFSNFTQTLQAHNSNQSDYSNRTYIPSQFNCQPLVQGGYTNMPCDSDDTPKSINGILQRNETSTRWNDAPSINIPMEQLPPFREKRSYTQVFEFRNSLCTQPQLSPLQDRPTARVTLFTPTKCATGNTEESAPNLNSSHWQKFQMSPISSDDSPEVYY